MQTKGRSPEQQVEADNNERRSHNVIITTSHQPGRETSQEQGLNRPKRAIVRPRWLKDYVVAALQTACDRLPQAEASPIDKEGTLRNTDWLEADRTRKAEARFRHG
ncbi:hypothetical protein T4D_9749 [Trichinella pseudospiralis]|nr:hypothetical protein T4D_13646 [Trichinella pseudospiralis]KRY87837.1 hypothetical protein T4D_8528 [Trichinella pseudospiralis]KRY89058.1 hypothetical protein T4D_9749 [Trichinella pseudospiralis]